MLMNVPVQVIVMVPFTANPVLDNNPPRSSFAEIIFLYFQYLCYFNFICKDVPQKCLYQDEPYYDSYEK